MRAVVQRVAFSSVEVEGEITGKTGNGLMVLVGFDSEDTEKDFSYIADKILNMRIFEDNEGKMNLSLSDLAYEILIVPNFTLYADARKGRRPSFSLGAKPQDAEKMFDDFVGLMKKSYDKVETGIFQADMKVSLLNDGPITILLDSSRLF